jgi:predicted unusual protein kinase regulating ubiquinone biosynthesis (AarF/ABC1/UbiB family)
MKPLEQYFNFVLNTVSIFSTSTYQFIKYKLNLETFNNAVISVCNSLVHKNYLFTKVVQWGVQEIYSDANIEGNDELKSYFSVFSNSVPYAQHELHASLLSIKNITDFAKSRNDELVVDNIPSNSGSVAIIFKARLNDMPVIIKVLRPNIRKRIEDDIKAVLFFFDNIFIRKIIEHYIKLKFNTFIQDNSESLLNQCDFINEVNNALLFKDNLKNKKNIIIPHVYKHFTEAHNEVIVMEYIDGPIAKNAPLELLKQNVETLQSFFFESLFRYNILHGDFHLGNIIIAENNMIGIIDFGIVYTLTSDVSDQLFNLLFLSLNTANTKPFLRAIIRYICLDPCKHDAIYKKILNDNEIVQFMSSEFSANLMIKVINKIMSDVSLGLHKDICRLFLSAMSGLQTVEYVNDNKSLDYLVKSYIRRSIQMDYEIKETTKK